MNPFSIKAQRARDLAAKLNKPTASEAAMAQAFPLGAGFGRGSEHSRSKKIDASVNRAIKAVAAQKRADYLTAMEQMFDRGEINDQGRAIQTQKDQEHSQKVNDFIARTVKVGDRVDIGGNDPLLVVKVNAKSVVTAGGCKWSLSEIARVISSDLVEGSEIQKA